MLHFISWSAFHATIFFLTLLYYTWLGVTAYRKEIRKTLQRIFRKT